MTFAGCSVLCKYNGCVRTTTLRNTRWVYCFLSIQQQCDYTRPLQNPISPEILRVVASRVQANDRNDHLLLSPETEEVGPFEPPYPREVSGLETYVPAYLNVPHLRRLAALVA